MGDELTCYIEFEFTGTGAAPTAKQWDDLLNAIGQQPLVQAIAAASSATGDHPDRQLSFTSLSPDGKKMLGQVTFIPDMLRGAVKDASLKTLLRELYEAAGGELPKEPDDLSIKDLLLTILDSEAGKRGTGGDPQAKLGGVLQAEAREVATRDLGYSGAQAGRIVIRTVAMGERETASAAAKAYARSNWNAEREQR